MRRPSPRELPRSGGTCPPDRRHDDRRRRPPRHAGEGEHDRRTGRGRLPGGSWDEMAPVISLAEPDQGLAQGIEVVHAGGEPGGSAENTLDVDRPQSLVARRGGSGGPPVPPDPSSLRPSASWPRPPTTRTPAPWPRPAGTSTCGYAYVHSSVSPPFLRWAYRNVTTDLYRWQFAVKGSVCWRPQREDEVPGRP